MGMLFSITMLGCSQASGGPPAQTEAQTVVDGVPYEDVARSPATFRAALNDKVEILDVDIAAGKVAFRVQMLPRDGEEHDCRYPGQAPGTGVTLGLVDLATGSVTEWTVYARVKRAEECTPEAEAKRQLAAAKARFAELGLDTGRMPPPLPVQRQLLPDGGHRDSLALTGRTVELLMEQHRGVNEERITPELRALGADSETHLAIGRWSGLSHPALFRVVNVGNAGGAGIALSGAWQEGGAAIVGWESTWFPCCTTYGFVAVR